MALFPKRNEPQQPQTPAEGPQAPAPAAPVNPLAPPSAQKGGAGLTRLPAGPPAQQPRKTPPPPPGAGSGKGPTPPGGLLPTPDWHREFDMRPPSARTSDSAPQPRAATEPTIQLAPERADDRPPTAQTAGRPVAPPAPMQIIPQSPRQEVLPPANYPSLQTLLRIAVEKGASDLHLSRGVPPVIRLDGYLIPLEFPPLTKEIAERLVFSVLNPVQRAKFDEDWELDFSLDLPDCGRFRVNVHRQRGGTEAAFRVVNDVILPLRRLGLPGVVEEIARKHSGLVLVTGPTGSGKSTTLASIVDQINNERQEMIITIEDPIEYVHKNKRSIVKQREVSSDTRNFENALRHVLRQDPDVVVVGEMRDLETISTALMAAETGHLVFATLHTCDAVQTVDRMIDVFPPHQQEQARIQVANTLQAIIAQQLLPVPGNRGRVVAVEILIATTAVRKIVRSGKTEQLYTAMQTSWEQGMITMDKSLKTLYQQGLISFDDAISRCKFPLEFDNI